MEYNVCTPGQPQSAVKLNRKPLSYELRCMAGMGLEIARLGKSYRVNVACPVNGDGYFYTRRELLDHNGFVVGSCRDDSGPSGEL